MQKLKKLIFRFTLMFGHGRFTYKKEAFFFKNSICCENGRQKYTNIKPTFNYRTVGVK